MTEIGNQGLGEQLGVRGAGPEDDRCSHIAEHCRQQVVATASYRAELAAVLGCQDQTEPVFAGLA